MNPGRPKSDGTNGCERFSAGWTGAVSLALFAYVAVAMLLIFVDFTGRPVLETFNLYSDSLASICVTILAGAAARGAACRGGNER